MKQLLALALVLLLPISVFAAEEEEPTNGQLSADIASLRSAVDRLQTSVTSLQTSVTTLQTSVTSLQGHVTKLVTKRGVAVIEIVSTDTARSHGFLNNPRYVLKGSTIEGFLDDESFGFAITDSNDRKLPSGTYLFELQQPPPIFHDCNSRGRLRACNPLKVVINYSPNKSHFSTKYPKGAAIFTVDGTVKFYATFALPEAVLTETGHSAAGHNGLLTITQLD